MPDLPEPRRWTILEDVVVDGPRLKPREPVEVVEARHGGEPSDMVHMSVRVDRALVAAITEVAGKNDRTVSEELRRAIRKHVMAFEARPGGEPSEEAVEAAHLCYFADAPPSAVEMACMRAALKAAYAVDAVSGKEGEKK